MSFTVMGRRSRVDPAGGKGVSLAEETKRLEILQREREKRKRETFYCFFWQFFFFWPTETDKVHDSRAQGFIQYHLRVSTTLVINDNNITFCLIISFFCFAFSVDKIMLNLCFAFRTFSLKCVWTFRIFFFLFLPFWFSFVDLWSSAFSGYHFSTLW